MASGTIESSSSQGSNPEQQKQSQQGRAITRSQIVQRLLATSANLPAFVNDLLTVQAVTVAGTEAAGFLLERVEQPDGKPAVGLKPIAHIRPDDSDAQTRAAAIQAFQELIKPCIQRNTDGALQVTEADGDVEPQFCLVTLLRNEGEVVAASAVITRCRDNDRAKQRLESMQLVAGYFDLYTLRRNVDQTRSIAQSHQHVLQLATSVSTGEGFEAAAKNLCNELATRTGATRVALGWMKGNKVKVKALSHTEQFDKKQELIVQIEKAMEECIDQEEAVQFDPSGESSTNNVTRDAASLSRAQGGNTVLSLPLRRTHQGLSEIVGVATLEFPPGTKLNPQAATGLTVAADLLAPQLYDRYQNDRWLITKAGISVRETAKLAIGPKHMLAKTVIALVIAGVVFLCVYRPMYHVATPFQFSALEKREIHAPYEGFIKDVFVKPGQSVKAGDPVLALNTTELEIERNKWRSRARSLELEAQRFEAGDKARNEPPNKAQAMRAMAEREEALAEVALLDERIRQATVTAPIDGDVFEIAGGDLTQKRGAKVSPTDVLLAIGQRENLRAELKVPERAIQDVKVGAKGLLATTSLPGDDYAITIDRIVPAGDPVEGENVFTVFATLDEKSPTWLPGMEGEAKVEVEPRTLLWQWTHRLTEWVRLKTWTWPIFGG